MTRWIASATAFVAAFAVSLFTAWDVSIGDWHPALRFLAAFSALYCAAIIAFIPSWKDR